MTPMIRTALIAAALVVAACTPTTEPDTAATAGGTIAVPDNADIVVIDGDTIDVNDIRYRLIGIDTPERGECGYDEATNHLADSLALGALTLVTTGETDRYDRTLAYLEAGDTDLNHLQISTGHAIARYDSQDGYAVHPREDLYRSTDNGTVGAPVGCP